MGRLTWALAGTLVLTAGLGAGPSDAISTLDGWPSRTVYLSNDAPFVVFGVTPTQLDRRTGQVQLSFIATDRLAQVQVFLFVSDTPAARTFLRRQVACGPREAGSWDCMVPVADLLAELKGPRGELGLRIEAHGDPRRPDEHSTVVVTLPVGRVGKSGKPAVAQTSFPCLEPLPRHVTCRRLQWLIIQGRLPVKVLEPSGARTVELRLEEDPEQHPQPAGCRSRP